MRIRRAVTVRVVVAAATALAAGCVAGAMSIDPPVANATSTATQTLFGDPLDGAPYWVRQTRGDCAEASAVVLHGELTGRVWSEAHMIAKAKAAGIPGGGVDGTGVGDIPRLYASMGLSATSAYASSLSAVEIVLAAGGKILAFVDAEKIWAADGWTVEDTGAMNHVLVVDSVDTARGLVTLTDTGEPAGATETVSVAVFGAAWAASGDDVIVVSL